MKDIYNAYFKTSNLQHFVLEKRQNFEKRPWKQKKSVGFFEQWTHINIKYTHFVNKRL